MKVVITGGAGFIGSNSAQYFLDQGHDVVVFDNFSRRGSRSNVEWLRSLPSSQKLTVVEGDIREGVPTLSSVMKDADAVLHLAAQVAVTTSVHDPREDFEINALGTFNVLETLRQLKSDALCIYSSTNKVYGGLEDLAVVEQPERYAFQRLKYGVPESRGLDFHSPYGASKGAADQYTRDYARIYGLNTVVFRQSCISGPRQFGVEDQGWVAWFLIALTLGKKITIYGNGKQVRDLLHVHDLVRAYDLAIQNKEKTRGQIYNIGGGHENAISVWHDFQPLLEEIFGQKLNVDFDTWRPGDQPIFVADIRKAKRDFGWKPAIAVRDGIRQLGRWVQDNKHLFM